MTSRGRLIEQLGGSEQFAQMRWSSPSGGMFTATRIGPEIRAGLRTSGSPLVQ
jgi:hypothetical protein